VTERTAHGDQAASPYWLRSHFKGTGLTLNRIRMDRQLEEALTHGPDPLHLTAVFGISERAAINYAKLGRQLLQPDLDINEA
jgi:hypothetical protein